MTECLREPGPRVPITPTCGQLDRPLLRASAPSSWPAGSPGCRRWVPPALPFGSGAQLAPKGLLSSVPWVPSAAG